MTGTFEMSERNQRAIPLLGMAANTEDKHLIAHLIPINLTMMQEAAGRLSRRRNLQIAGFEPKRRFPLAPF